MKSHTAIVKVIAVAIPGMLLLGACGQEDASPSEQPPAQVDDVAGRTFITTDVAVNDGGTPPPNGGDDMSLTFTDSGISATGGCNTMSGAATISDATLVVSDGLAMTEMGCEEPRMAQDTWFADLLTSDPSIALAADTLTLNGDGIVVTLIDSQSGVPAATLVGPVWTLDSLVVGDLVSSVPQGVKASLEFTNDGTVNVQFGCNTGSGSYTVAGSTITFGPVSSTLIGCKGPAQDVEATVSKLLSKDVNFTIDNQLLTLTAGDEGLIYRAP